MKNSFYIIFIALIACSKVVEVDIPFEKPNIVVNSLIHPDTFFTAELTQSNFILDTLDYFRYILDAQVEVYEDGNYLGDLLYDNLYFNYANNTLFPKPGSIYELRVLKPNYELVTAQTTVPVAAPQFEILNIQDVIGEFGNIEKELTIKITDVPENSYYEFFIKEYQFNYNNASGNTIVEDSVLYRLGMMTSDLLVSPDGDIYYSNEFLFDDVLFRNSSYTFKLSLPYLSYNFTLNKLPPDYYLLISMRSIHEEYYKYKVSYNKQREVEFSPFAESVFVYNNINNGLGLFSSYYEYSMDTIIH